MTSRDFGIVTLRNAVAYHFDGSIVPINNVYITSTNGGAVFSDTLTISTINVSTINGGGIGGGVSSITAGTNISITGTASDPIVNVDINSTLLMNGFPIYDNSTITIAAGSSINLSTLSTSIVLDQASQGITITSVPTTTINGNGATNAQLNINGSASIRGSTAQLEIYDGLSVQQGSLAYNVADTAIHLNAINQLDLTGDQGVALTANGGTGVVLTASGPGTGGSIRFRTLNPTGNLNVEIEGSISLTAGYNNNTGNINLYTASTSIILDQLASQSITLTANNGININAITLINGTIKVASTFYDNNASSGTSGQVLTAGTGGQVAWSTITGSGGWVSTATSPLNMNTYQINNISSASSATDVPQVNNVQSAVNTFAAGTNGWNITPAEQFTIYQNSFGGASSTLVTYGNIYNGTSYQGNTSHILPPSKFSINFRCPVATSSTPLGPETNWPINVPYYIRCELLSYNAGLGTVLAWLDTQTVTGWVYNTGAPNNIPYLSFNVILCSNTSVPIDSAGNGRVIALNFTLASVNAPATYAFNPNANGYTYQDCAGIEVSVTTLTGTTGSGLGRTRGGLGPTGSSGSPCGGT